MRIHIIRRNSSCFNQASHQRVIARNLGQARTGTADIGTAITNVDDVCGLIEQKYGSESSPHLRTLLFSILENDLVSPVNTIDQNIYNLLTHNSVTGNQAWHYRFQHTTDS